MAKEQRQPEPASVLDDQETPEPPKSYRMQITLALVGMILFQMIVLFLLLPSKAQTRERGGVWLVTEGSDGSFNGTPQVPPSVGPNEPVVERSINEGPFRIGFTEDGNNITLSMVIHVVIRDRDSKRFDTRFEHCQWQIIDKVNTALRASSPADRQEVGHTTIKERLKRAINEVLGTSWVLEVLISESTVQET